MFDHKVLVTGASGFIGSHLSARLLKDGHAVTCLLSDRWKSKDLPQHDRCRYVFGDVTDPLALKNAVQQIDVVYHLAARTRNLRGTMLHVNRDGTKNLLEQCASQERKPVIVMVSSLAAAGPAHAGKPRVETDSANPVSLYGKSKLAAEKICREFSDQLPISIVRPPVVFGPNDPHSFLLFRPIARHGIHVIPGYRDPVCSLIHSEDLVSAMIRVAETGKRIRACTYDDAGSAEGVYFVADQDNPKYSVLGKMIGESVGRERVFNLHVPYWMIRVAGLVGESSGKITGSLPFMNADKAREITAGDWICNADAIFRDTQFRPKFGLRERIKQTAVWYFENGWLKRPSKPRRQYSHGDRQKVADS